MIIIISILILFVYFIPSFVAVGKRNFNAIFILNIMLGWTFIGWVMALVWACTKDDVK